MFKTSLNYHFFSDFIEINTLQPSIFTSLFLYLFMIFHMKNYQSVINWSSVENW